jgi:hypothetical protein
VIATENGAPRCAVGCRTMGSMPLIEIHALPQADDDLRA